MTIINQDKGEAYSLTPGTQIEVERPNPFFSEYGELTAPVSLPDNDRNRRLLGFPDLLGGNLKQTRIKARIEDGEYSADCLQAVLSARRKHGIETAFYLNDGAFYTNMQKATLKDVFGDECVKGVTTVSQAIEFCRSLWDDSNPEFAIFPVMVDNDSGMETGFDHKFINAYGVQSDSAMGVRVMPAIGGKTSQRWTFFNEENCYEWVDGVQVSLTPGYYITPFIRCCYVLRRIFRHFGYELQDNFFTQTAPFSKMVFLNNNIDTLVNGRIRLAHLVPDVTCKDVLDYYRRKFCCEFFSDEVTKTVDVRFLSQVLDGQAAADLTDRLAGEPDIQYRTAADYSRIVLKPKQRAATDGSDSYESLTDLLGAFPTADFDPVTGGFVMRGWQGFRAVEKEVADCALPFNMGGSLEEKTVEVPECMTGLRDCYNKIAADADEDTGYGLAWKTRLPYVGKGRALNSSVQYTGDTDRQAQTAADTTLPLMVATPMLIYGRMTDCGPFCIGTPGNTDYQFDSVYQPTGRLRWNYTLYYYGTNGVFERFYRSYDTLLRNSLNTVKAKLLLSQHQKMTIPSWQKVTIRGVELLLKKLKFTLGGHDQPVESELYTVRPYTDSSGQTDRSPLMDELLTVNSTGYRWAVHKEMTSISEDAYNRASDRDMRFTSVFPPLPTADYANGRRYFERTASFRCYKVFPTSKVLHVSGGSGDIPDQEGYYRETVWLTCVRQ